MNTNFYQVRGSLLFLLTQHPNPHTARPRPQTQQALQPKVAPRISGSGLCHRLGGENLSELSADDQVRRVPTLPAGVLRGGADAALPQFTEYGCLFPIQFPVQLNMDFHFLFNFLFN